MRRILVIFGGCSTEYEVSLQSAAAVAEAIDVSRYEVLYLGISREGEAYYYTGDTEGIRNGSWQKQALPATVSMSRGEPVLWIEDGRQLRKVYFDMAFPVMHGKNGEDGTLQGLCEMAGIPVVGCGMESSCIGMDKQLAHTLAKLVGVRVPESVVLQSPAEYAQKQEDIQALGLPVYVKPVRAGSSFGITRVVKKEDMEQAVKEAFRHDGEVLIEEEISGFEVGCAVMGNEELTLGRVDEIELQKSEGDSFFDYEEKYTLKTSVIHMPARISAEEEARVREAAVKIYRALHCRDFTREDLFYTDKKEIVFNEVNTIPGFTSHSRFPNMMKGIGSDFAQTVNGIIGATEKRTEDVKDAAKHGQHNG